jgi:hypothetical protein
MEVVPDELVFAILDFLDSIESSKSLMLTSKRFHRIISQSQAHWQKMCKLEWTSHSLPFDLEWLRTQTGKSWFYLASCFERQRPTGLSYQTQPIAIGRFKGAQLNGWGMLAHSEDSLRFGTFVNGLMEGRGSIRWKDSSSFDGFFSRGQRNGAGRYVSSYGAVLEGEWKQDHVVRGTYTWPSGLRYEGEFRGSLFHGVGVMVWPNGFTYKGCWVRHEPRDTLAGVHPKIAECISGSRCTAQVTGRGSDYPQILYKCGDCKKDYCATCWESCHGEKHYNHRRRWMAGAFCDCDKDHKPAKKRRVVSSSFNDN